VIYGDCAFVDADGALLRLVPGHTFDISVLRYYGCFISSCTTFVRVSAIEAVGGWNEDLRRSMDWDLWLRLAANGARFRYIPAPLSAFRVHEAQVTATPESADADEFSTLDGMHNITRSRRSARAAKLRHRRLKLAEGAYVRELRAKRLRPERVAWTSDGLPTAAATALAHL
jgi:GT2 family glycosyltransferase